MKDRTCTRCRGFGMRMPPEGTTRADMVDCNLCEGTGKLPNGYVKNFNEVRRTLNKLKQRDGSVVLKKFAEV